MVIFGGLELVAAGYVLHELHKDDEKPRSSEDRRRRRHRHDSQSHSHSHHRRDSDNRPRPPRPETLALPIMAPLRPNSAPPQQTFQPRPGGGGGGGGPFPPGPGGPWMNQMPIQHQQQRPPNPPPQGLPHPQTWPHPNANNGPQNQPPNRPMYLASDFPPNPHQQQQAPPPPPQQQPPPGPGNLAHRPTMHFDMKTGKWQLDMLPPEMPRSDSMPAGLLNIPSSRNRSASLQPPPSRLRQESHRGHGHARGSFSSSGSDSYSSGSDSSSDDRDLAYGSLPGERRRRRGPIQRIVSRERARPIPPQQQQQLAGGGGGGRDYYGQSLGAGGNGGGRGSASMPVEMPHQMRYELQG
ncbi:hypothetical protein LTR84_007067 [Exophiala bonariae]|uniref:Uncharacterized protein n=1 Tax=Exophiala bonariae TaxID=1690606 RepID=A0AAV9N264_9EURO|nr:hypothetical protein LTR84_007067 [Exophiala bonariae]